MKLILVNQFSSGGLRALGTAVALQTAHVGVLCGGHGAVSIRSGLLSVGVEVRWGVAGSLFNSVSVQSGRVSIMCGGASSWASPTMVLSASMGSIVFCEEQVFAPLDTAITPPIQMADKQEKKLNVQTLYDRQVW